MSNLPPSRIEVQTGQVQTRRPASELLVQAISGTANHYLERSREPYKFNVNGIYSGQINALGVDGLYVFDFDITITNVVLFSNVPGAGAITELDLKVGTSGGAYTSIFSTTPKAAPAHGLYAYVGVGGTETGLTAPVLSTTDIDAGQAIRFDIISSMTGNPRDCGLLMYYFKR
jgi:hypothetical protein